MPYSMMDLPKKDGVKFACIPGWPLYAVGDDGTVWSKWSGAWQELAPIPCTGGHVRVNLSPPNAPSKKVPHFIQCLVLEAFEGPRPTRKHEACHFDGDKWNNRRDNLYWGTKSQNNLDRTRHRSQFEGQ